MEFINAIEAYLPVNRQEEQDKQVILNFIKEYGSQALLRDNEIAHITSSGFIMNPTFDKVLLVHHNIRNTWSWTGGHADGDEDLLRVALKEATEETGVEDILVLTNQIASLDILPVFGHIRKSIYVNAHLHLSAAYLLIADENSTVRICFDENSGVEWFPLDRFTEKFFDQRDVYLYSKLISFAQNFKKQY